MSWGWTQKLSRRLTKETRLGMPFLYSDLDQQDFRTPRTLTADPLSLLLCKWSNTQPLHHACRKFCWFCPAQAKESLMEPWLYGGKKELNTWKKYGAWKGRDSSSDISYCKSRIGRLANRFPENTYQIGKIEVAWQEIPAAIIRGLFFPQPVLRYRGIFISICWKAPFSTDLTVRLMASLSSSRYLGS